MKKITEIGRKELHPENGVRIYKGKGGGVIYFEGASLLWEGKEKGGIF